MLAEMGDNTFELGHVDTDSYRSLILSDKLVDFVASSLTQCAPECSDCVFEPHRGADPVYHHATQRDPVGDRCDEKPRCSLLPPRYLRMIVTPLAFHVSLEEARARNERLKR
jgi:hypothetical protein